MLPMPTSTSRQSTIDEAEGSDIDEAESISSYGCCASDGLGCALHCAAVPVEQTSDCARP